MDKYCKFYAHTVLQNVYSVVFPCQVQKGLKVLYHYTTQFKASKHYIITSTILYISLLWRDKFILRYQFKCELQCNFEQICLKVLFHYIAQYEASKHKIITSTMIHN